MSAADETDRALLHNQEQARRLFAQVKAILQRYPNVHGVSVGMRHVNGAPTGEAAFVVDVTTKLEPDHPHERLPRELLGIPIDVQQTPKAKLTMDVAGGGELRRANGNGSGRIGMVALGAGGSKYALTAMHVLSDNIGTHQALGAGLSFEVEARMFSTQYETVGRLAAADFDTEADIACVALDANHPAAASVLGSDVQFMAPAPPNDIPLGGGVNMIVPGIGTFQGSLVAYPHDGDFLTAAGEVHFRHLMKIRLPVGNIQGGWSGSALFRPVSRKPIALLSFGSLTANANGDCYAYGFPLHAFYQAWGLRPV